jgi:hypothetical protein
MSTLRGDASRRTPGTSDGWDDSAVKTGNWIGFSALVLTFAGAFGLIDGIMAISRSSFYVADAEYVFSDVRTWGWILTLVSVVALLAAYGIASGAQWARWTGIAVAGLQALTKLLMVQAYPFWTLVVFTLDLLVVYGLAVYGGRRNPLV